jgi:hypothetical protein
MPLETKKERKKRKAEVRDLRKILKVKAKAADKAEKIFDRYNTAVPDDDIQSQIISKKTN